MKTIRVLVLVALGASAFCGFAQDGAPRAGAPAGSAVVLNRKAAPTKQEVVPTDKYPFAALQKSLEQSPGAEIGTAAASVGLGVKVPLGWEPSKDVALSETRARLLLSRRSSRMSRTIRFLGRTGAWFTPLESDSRRWLPLRFA